MNLVNSKDIVTDRIRDLQALAAVAPPRGYRQRRGTWRGPAALASARILVRPQSTMKAVEEL